tara:strand:+ start:2897 stop:3163 length:267 start_codon:yes stop_codon:yes gene_type:complete
MECVLCKGDIDVQIHGWDQGHNAQPLAEGRCCSDCNGVRVIPARIRQVMGDEKMRRKAEKAWKHADTTDFYDVQAVLAERRAERGEDE